MNRNNAALVFVLLLAALLAGCGGERIYNLSGTVTFQGKPVPAGQIVFEPDASAGNSGPAAFAKIKDGKYDTRILDGRGTVGGPHLVRIHGRDGIPRGELLNGLPLFRDYETKIDLPKADVKQDFEVPAGGRQ
jgi:hypothetical protein